MTVRFNLATFGLLFAFLGLSPGDARAQRRAETSFQARGCCPWCEENMVNALEGVAVLKIHWDQTTERMAVVYRPRKITSKEIQRRVALAGHDTDAFPAPDSAYFALPACCRYRD
jgi:Cu(I)/Ag(I) efflux system membrane fusion protein